jgi:hypothetical protein
MPAGFIMEFPQLVQQYGWIIAIGYIILRDVFPRLWSFFADKLFPERILERKRADDRLEEAAKADRESKATLLRAQIEREDREAEQRLKLEERTVVAIERLEAATSTNNTMLTTLHAAFVQHERFTYNASMDIKDSIEKLQDLEGMKKRQAALEKEVQTITQQKIRPAKP